jgi:hypothetical protein
MKKRGLQLPNIKNESLKDKLRNLRRELVRSRRAKGAERRRALALCRDDRRERRRGLLQRRFLARRPLKPSASAASPTPVGVLS